jgi:hypothetical protein
MFHLSSRQKIASNLIVPLPAKNASNFNCPTHSSRAKQIEPDLPPLSLSVELRKRIRRRAVCLPRGMAGDKHLSGVIMDGGASSGLSKDPSGIVLAFRIIY